MGLADTARLAVQLDLKGNFAAQLRANQSALGKFDAQISKTQSRAFRAGQQIGTGIKNTARIATSIVAAGAGVVAASLKVAGDFEAQLRTINTIARETPPGLSKIGDGIRKVARDTGTATEDLTQGYYDLLSAGIKAADAQNVLTQANTLAIGGLSTTAETVDLLTTAINVYGGDASKAAQFTDEFAKAIERGKVTAAELAGSYAQVAPLAKSLGIENKELAAGYARLTAAGTPAAEAATQWAAALTALLKKTPDLEKLEKATHKNYAAIAGKQGLNVALQQMRTDADKAGIELVDLVGRKEALLYILQTTGVNLKAYNADLAAMGSAAGTAAAQMAERQQGLNFQLSRLKALAKDAGISIGSALLPKLTPLIARLNEFVGGTSAQNAIKQFGDNVAGLFSDNNIKSGVEAIKTGFETAKAAAPVIAQAAKATLGFVQAAVAVFRSLPAPLQGLLAGGFALNKITGGLVTNIAGGIIETVGKNVFQRGSSPANALWVQQVNGGLGGGAGGGGLLGKLGSILTKVTIVGIGLEAANVFRDVVSGILPKEVAKASPGNPFGLFSERPQDRLAGTKTIGVHIDPPGVQALTKALQSGLKGPTTLGEPEKFAGRMDEVGQFAKVFGTQMGRLIDQLKGARTGKEIAAAVKAALQTVVKDGRGNVENTTKVLAGLRKQLGNTHDPKLQAALRGAIAKIEHKVAARADINKLITKADQVGRSTNRTTAQKIKDLESIQKSIGTRSVNATRIVQQKIDAAKRAQVAAEHQTQQAVKNKDLSVTVNVPRPSVSIHQVFNGMRILNQYTTES